MTSCVLAGLSAIKVPAFKGDSLEFSRKAQMPRRPSRPARRPRSTIEGRLDTPPPLDPAQTAKTRARRRLIGAIALALAVTHPECVAGLALLAPASQFQDTVPPALRGLAIRSDLLRWIVGWTIAMPMGLRAGPKTAAILFGPDPAPDDFGTRGGALLALRPWTFRNASRDLLAAHDIGRYVARYGQIDMPVGVLFGTGDRILDHTLHGETLVTQIAGLDLELIELGGHMIPLSAPDRSAAFIVRMAAKVKMP